MLSELFNTQDPLEQEFNATRAAAQVQSVVAQYASHTDRAGQITDEQSLVRFVQAGKATLTIRSKKTGERFTFRFSRPKEEDGRARPIWVSLLSGPQNESDYAFVGTVWVGSPAWTLKMSAKSRISEAAPSVKALRWFLKHVNVDVASAFAQAEFWHEGRCGRCGRKLTVPESIATGFGPECAGMV